MRRRCWRRQRSLEEVLLKDLGVLRVDVDRRVADPAVWGVVVGPDGAYL